MRILVSGIIAQYAMAGLSLHYLQFVLGLLSLGHDVYYVEDNGAPPFSPVTQNVDIDYSYNLPHIRGLMDRYGLSDRWAYMHYKGGFFGLPSEKVRDLYRTADLWLNISGATYPREEHLGIPKRAYLDTDPAFMQITVATGDPDKTWGIHAHNVHLTFAENIGRPGCTVPDDGIRWQPCRQPVHLPLWEPAYTPHAEAFTTVTNYTAYKPLEFRGETYGQKDLEFRRFIDLPCRTPQTMEVALVAVEEVKAMFREHGWWLRDPVAVTKDVDSYQAYIAGSRAEWSVAKNAYVRTNSGWISERDANYLAAGKPVLTQDTGLSENVPVGEGFLAFRTMDECLYGIEEINADYALHCRRAREIAEAHFSAPVVLPPMLERCMGDPA